MHAPHDVFVVLVINTVSLVDALHDAQEDAPVFGREHCDEATPDHTSAGQEV